MRRARSSAVVGIAVVAAAALGSVSASASVAAPSGGSSAAAALVARLPFDVINPAGPAGLRSTPETVTKNRGQLDGATTVSTTLPGGAKVAPISPDGTGAFYFPGWHAETAPEPSGTVDPTKSSVRVDSRTDYQPGATATSFSVSLYIRADKPNGEILGRSGPNIIQKGRVEDPGGSWKIYHQADMRPACQFRGITSGGATPTSHVVEALGSLGGTPSTPRLQDGKAYRLVCSLSRAVSGATQTVTTTLTVTPIDPNPKNPQQPWTLTSAPFTTAAFDVSPQQGIWIGHKPPKLNGECDGCDAPGDAFAGVIDDISISK